MLAPAFNMKKEGNIARAAAGEQRRDVDYCWLT
jgi:hypothetical protein